MKVYLSNNRGFLWYQKNNLFFKGYFFIEDTFYEKENALNYISKIVNYEDLKKFIAKINGVFTILKKEENTLFLVSDISRSFPVFYAKNKKNWLFSDDINFIQNQLKEFNYDALSELEFRASNHTHGDKTLLKDIYQIQSSEYILFVDDKINERNFYFSYSTDKESTLSYRKLKEQAIYSFENSFKRFIKSINNKTIVIPLSGGFDSRLIAVMLKKYNYKNVICFTYGRKDSFEIENSKKTAEKLNFEWHFIEYTNELISKFLTTKQFKNYAHFAGKLSSMPYLQEYFAIKLLKEKQIIPQDAIFVPGFAGDILGGSEYSKNISKNLNHCNIAKLILNKKMTNYSFSNDEKKLVIAEIKNNLALFDENYKIKIPETVFDNYNLKERITKYIFNSASYYTFFDYQFRFPFWDKELLIFFKDLPVKYKQEKLLFDDVLINDFFKPFGVHFAKEIQPTKKQIQIQKIKDKIKPFLPNHFKERILEKHDWNNYKPITDQMSIELNNRNIKVKKLYKDYNEIISQWYINFSKKKI